jgi:hypothetical protein
MRKATLMACLLASARHSFVHAPKASVNTLVLPDPPNDPLTAWPLATSRVMRKYQRSKRSELSMQLDSISSRLLKK